MGHVSSFTTEEKHINVLMGKLQDNTPLSEKERAELCCYLRQRQGMLESLAWLSSHAARALVYIARMWITRGESIIPSVRFFLPCDSTATTVFYYQKMLDMVKSVQDDVKRYDSELNFGFEDTDG